MLDNDEIGRDANDYIVCSRENFSVKSAKEVGFLNAWSDSNMLQWNLSTEEGGWLNRQESSECIKEKD